MTKKEACCKLAEINESMYDIQVLIEKASSGKSDKEIEANSYIQDLKQKYEKLQAEHDAFYSEYESIIHS